MSVFHTMTLSRAFDRRIFLKTLGLSRAKFNEQSLKMLSNFIKTSQWCKQLNYLDLSEIIIISQKQQSETYYDFFDAISRNRQIQYLNLSGNHFCGQSGYDAQIGTYLSQIIKHKLTHLNLSSCNLNWDFIIEFIGPALKKSRSLQCIHLGNNPWEGKINGEDFQKFQSIIHSKIQQPSIFQNLKNESEKPDFNLLKPQNNYELAKINEINEQINRLQDGVLKMYGSPFEEINPQIAISRILGHKHDLPGAGQWQIFSESKLFELDDVFKNNLVVKQKCRFCQRKPYILYFWSKTIAKKILKDSSEHNLDIELPNLLNSLQNIFQKSSLDQKTVRKVNENLKFTSKYEYKPFFGQNLEELERQQKRYKVFYSIDPIIRVQLSQPVTSRKRKRFGGKMDLKGETAELATCILENRDEALAEIFYDSTLDKFQPQNPFIFCAGNNNWVPTQMIEVTDFCRLLKSFQIETIEKKPQAELKEQKIISLLKKQSSFSAGIKSYDDLSAIQKINYRLTEMQIYKQEKEDCLNTLFSLIPPNQTQMVNSSLAFQQILNPYDSDPVYVLPLYLHPGKHNLLITQKTGENSVKCLQNFLISPQENLPQPKLKPLIDKKDKTKVEKVFIKPKSVFAQWNEDSQDVYNHLFFKHDVNNWSIQRLIKDVGEYQMVVQIMHQNMYVLKEMFANCQANSPIYPQINVLTCSGLLNDLKLFDSKLRLADADRMYTAATTKINKNKDDEDGGEAKKKVKTTRDAEGSDKMHLVTNAMNRADFFEFLIRIVKRKYVETGEIQTISEALTNFFKSVLPVQMPALIPWQSFREKKLWNKEVNEIFFVNLELLKKAYQFSIIGKKKKSMSFKDALIFMSSGNDARHSTQGSPKSVVQTAGSQQQLGFAQQDVASQISNQQLVKSNQNMNSDGFNLQKQSSYLTLSERQARVCYAMCKMTCIQEETESIAKYDKLLFVEFLELLGRIAQVRFENTENREPFITRLEWIIDSTLGLIGAERLEINLEESDFSETDNEY